MKPIDLDAIRALMARRDVLAEWPNRPSSDADEIWQNRYALADAVPDLVAEVERLRNREAHFAAALGVADGGQYRNDWDGALRRLVAERDRLRAERDTLHRYVVLWSAQFHGSRLPSAQRDDATILARAQEMEAIEAGLDPAVFDWLVLMEAALESADPPRVEQDAADGWFRDGKEAAIQELEIGTKPGNPHAEGSPAAQWWSRGYSYNWRQFNALRAAQERDAAEGKVLPAGWTIHEGVWVRTVAHRTDLEITVHRGARSGSIPFTRIVTYRADGNVVKRIEADTVLAAIEAAETWLKESAR